MDLLLYSSIYDFLLTLDVMTLPFTLAKIYLVVGNFYFNVLVYFKNLTRLSALNKFITLNQVLHTASLNPYINFFLDWLYFIKYIFKANSIFLNILCFSLF